MAIARRLLPLLAATAMVLSSCSKHEPGLPGTWINADPKAKASALRFVFNEDGTGKMRLDKDTITNFTWEIDGKTMFIKSKSTRSGGQTTEKTEFNLDGDQLIFTLGGQTLNLERR